MFRSARAAAADRRLPRTVLGLGIAFGTGYLAFTVLETPGFVATDFEIYRGAAANYWAGEATYGRSPVGVPEYTFRYPPILLAWFSTYLLAPPVAGFGVHLAGTLAAAIGLAVVLVRATERVGVDLAALDRGLIAGFVVLSPFAIPSIVTGNVNHHVALALALGLAWLADGRQRRAGVAMGLAAVVKLFPVGVGLWLLRRRAWTAVGAAVATGLSALLAGIALFGPGTTGRYARLELFARSAPDAFAGGLPPTSVYVTLWRPLSQALPGAGAPVLLAVSVALLAPLVVACYRAVDTPVGRLCAVLATLVGVLLVLPSYSLYFLVALYPLVPLLYALEPPVRTLLGAGAALSLLTLNLVDVRRILAAVDPPGAGSMEAVARSVYTVGTPELVGGLLVLVACAWRATREASA